MVSSGESRFEAKKETLSFLECKEVIFQKSVEVQTS